MLWNHIEALLPNLMRAGNGLGYVFPFIVIIDVDHLVLTHKFGWKQLLLWAYRVWLINFLLGYAYNWLLTKARVLRLPFSSNKASQWGCLAANMHAILQFTIFCVTAWLHTYWNRIDLMELIACSLVTGALVKSTSGSVREVLNSTALCCLLTIVGLVSMVVCEHLASLEANPKRPFVVCLENVTAMESESLVVKYRRRNW